MRGISLTINQNPVASYLEVVPIFAAIAKLLVYRSENVHPL